MILRKADECFKINIRKFSGKANYPLVNSIGYYIVNEQLFFELNMDVFSAGDFYYFFRP